MSRYEKVAVEEVFPARKDLDFARICAFNGKLFYVIQETQLKRLSIFDLKNRLLLVTRELAQRVTHAEFGSIRHQEVLYVCFDDNSVKIFELKPDSGVGAQTVLEALSAKFKTKPQTDSESSPCRHDRPCNLQSVCRDGPSTSPSATTTRRTTRLCSIASISAR